MLPSSMTSTFVVWEAERNDEVRRRHEAMVRYLNLCVLNVEGALWRAKSVGGVSKGQTELEVQRELDVT